MSLQPFELPKFIVLEPGGGVRLDVELPFRACEIDLALENESPGRNFVLMLGHPSQHFVQRVRIAGRAKLFFDTGDPGLVVFLLTNPMREPAVIRLRVRPILEAAPGKAKTGARAGAKARRTHSPPRHARTLYTRGG